MVLETDDRCADVSGVHPSQQSDPLFGHFTRHEGLFGRHPGRPVMYDPYSGGVIIGCINPRNDSGQDSGDHNQKET